MAGPSAGVGLGVGATVCVGIGGGVVVGVGVGVAVGIGVEVGSGVGVADAVGARVLVGIAAGVRVGVADAIAVGVVVGDMAIGVSVGARAHAANSKRIKHTTLALHESRRFIFSCTTVSTGTAAHFLEPLSTLNSAEPAEDAIARRHQRPSAASVIPTYGHQ